MRVVFATPFYAPEWKFGGPPRKIHGLAKCLIAKGHDLTVITLDSEDRTKRSYRIVDGVVAKYSSWFGAGLRQCPSSLATIREEVGRVDMVHCFGLYNLICPLAAWFSARAGKPFIVEPMGMFIPRNRSILLKRLYHFFVMRWLLRNAAAVISTSELEARELQGHVDSKKIYIRPNGVTFEDVPTVDRIETRRKLGVGQDEKLIGYLGRISRKKQLTNLVKAFESADASTTKLLIAGPVTEPDYQRELLRVIGESPRKQDIIVRGLLEGDRYVGALKALDLFVLPSENENFGNAAAEAILARVPVLLTHDCGVAPVIDGRVGLAVRQGIEALTNGMRTMLRPEMRHKWGPNWSKVQAELSWDDPVRIQEQIYEKIRGGN